MAYDRQRSVESAYLIPGWAWPNELGVLWDMLGRSRLHVEVGAFCGKSLFMAAMSVPDGARVVGVDAMVPHPHVPSMAWAENVLEETLTDARTKRPLVDVSWLKLDHLEAARKLRGQPITSVYLDADHHFAETLAAIQAWYPLVAPGGLIMGHDYWTGDGAVIDAVTTFFAEAKLEFHTVPGTRIWFHEKA
jgi:cephalosporin hydroxylase